MKSYADMIICPLFTYRIRLYAINMIIIVKISVYVNNSGAIL